MKVYIVDAIFVGSRLTVTAHVCRYLQSIKVPFEIITKVSSRTEHYDEVFEGLEAKLVEVATVSPGVWFQRLSAKNVKAIVDYLLPELERNPDSVVFFTGFNEYYPHIARFIKSLTLRGGARVFGIDYDSHSWLKAEFRDSWSRIFKDWFKRIHFSHLLRSCPNFFFISMDDRLFDRAREHSKVHPGRIKFLVDPCPSDGRVASELKSCGRRINVMLVGLQSKRKGLGDILGLIEQRLLPRNIQINLVGRLPAGENILRDRIRRLQSNQFSFREGFLSEQELTAAYLENDYVLLPYTKAFKCSSGVLATATSLGIPVITTAHGLIGYRVQMYGLGLRYNSGDLNGLSEVLRALPRRDGVAYGKFRDAVANFNESNGINEFNRCLEGIFCR